MLFHERYMHNLTSVDLFLEELSPALPCPASQYVPDVWTVGIIFNVHRFPMDLDGNEQIQVGFHLPHGTDLRHQSTWRFVEDVVVLTPSKVGQFALCWHGDRSITRSSWPLAGIGGKRTQE